MSNGFADQSHRSEMLPDAWLLDGAVSLAVPPALWARPKTEVLQPPLTSQQLKIHHSLLPSACILLLLLLVFKWNYYTPLLKSHSWLPLPTRQSLSCSFWHQRPSKIWPQPTFKDWPVCPTPQAGGIAHWPCTHFAFSCLYTFAALPSARYPYNSIPNLLYPTPGSPLLRSLISPTPRVSEWNCSEAPQSW